MRVACESSGLNEDFGIKVSGSVRDVNFTATLGEISASVDWRKQSGNGAQLTQAQIDGSGILKLAAAVSTAAGVWYNLTKDVKCFGIGESGKVNGTADAAAPPKSHLRPRVPPRASSQSFTSALRAKFERNAAAASPSVSASASAASFLRDGGGSACPTCPPCDDCPPCPVSYCDWEDTAPCDYVGNLSKTFSWEGIGCNEALSQVDIHGVGRGAFKCVCVCVCVSACSSLPRTLVFSPPLIPSFLSNNHHHVDRYLLPPRSPYAQLHRRELRWTAAHHRRRLRGTIRRPGASRCTPRNRSVERLDDGVLWRTQCVAPSQHRVEQRCVGSVVWSGCLPSWRARSERTGWADGSKH